MLSQGSAFYIWGHQRYSARGKSPIAAGNCPPRWGDTACPPAGVTAVRFLLESQATDQEAACMAAGAARQGAGSLDAWT